MFCRTLTRLLLLLAMSCCAALAAEPLGWFQAGRPTQQARDAVSILGSAAEHGLDPQDYGAATLQAALAQTMAGPWPADEASVARLDAALTRAVLDYLKDLDTGRIDPRQVHARFAVPPRNALPDTASQLREAVAKQRVAQMLRQAPPQLPLYVDLQQALARYRGLSPSHPAWRTALPPLPAPARKLVSGQASAGLELLAQRLQALGDLPAGMVLPATFEGALVTALAAFQERHGLANDGVLGRTTLQQLDVAPQHRARQIELALERLRWTPLLRGPRMVVVNVPEFVLRAYEVRDGRIDVRLTMKVIVGKALDTRTPLMDEDMQFIEFSPYWNVPPSIARNEVLPRLRRDPAYFHEQGFEFVTHRGQVVTTLAPDHLGAVQSGDWRIRQRPGPKNALGDIKFVFPNNDNIYLHHTPAPQLFERERRDFSHGCIRIEDPVGLARFVLQEEPVWTEERIRAAMQKGTSSTLRLAQPLPVLIAYSTVLVKRGRVYFYPDLYRHDQLLDQALRQRGAARRPPGGPTPGAR
jgi:murein L,D-transpeptidase YcbB/YkuD